MNHDISYSVSNHPIINNNKYKMFTGSTVELAVMTTTEFRVLLYIFLLTIICRRVQERHLPRGKKIHR